MSFDINSKFIVHYNQLNKAIPKKEDQKVLGNIERNLKVIGDIHKTSGVALPVFGNDGNIALDEGTVGQWLRPMRGFISRNIYQDVSNYDNHLENIEPFVKYVKNYLNKNTPSDATKLGEVEDSINEATKGLKKLKTYYKDNKYEVSIINDAIKNLKSAKSTIREDFNNKISSSFENRLQRIINNKAIPESKLVPLLKSEIEKDFDAALKLQVEGGDIRNFFKRSAYASSPKNQSAFLASIMVMQNRPDKVENLGKFLSDLESIDTIPIGKAEKKELEFELIKQSELFPNFIEDRAERKASKLAKTGQIKDYKEDQMVKATLKFLAAGGLAALAWKCPNYRAALPYAINFAFSAYGDTQSYWRATTNEEKVLIIKDVEALLALEDKSPGTILKKIQEIQKGKTEEGEKTTKELKEIIDTVHDNLRFNIMTG